MKSHNYLRSNDLTRYFSICSA